MAPSSRTRASRIDIQQPISKISFGRVTKASKLNAQPQYSSKHKAELETLVALDKKSETPKQHAKRKLDEVENDDRELERATRKVKPLKKAKLNIQLTTPPPSSPESCSSSPEPLIQLPDTLKELISIHKVFVSAMSLQYAHGAGGTTTSLAILLPSMTRLWKKRSVQQRDIERMLAIWELCDIEVGSIQRKVVKHNRGPFKLAVAGIGSCASTTVEYTWMNEKRASFLENVLQQQYEDTIERVYRLTQATEYPLGSGSIHEFPVLECGIGKQTTIRQEKASIARKDVLQLSAKTQSSQPDISMSNLSLSDPFEPTSRPAVLKSRTLSLFDRVRAKQMASASSPNSAALLRRRAISRISDVTDILRMKQAQKLNSQFQSDVHGSPTRMKARMKVSFSVDALVREIKDSVQVSLGDEEIKECLNILGRELQDTWCSLYELGGVRCITLQGEGRSGIEMKNFCEKAFSL